MSLFSALGDYKFAVINTSYRSATLLDITLFKSFDEGRKFMRESAREMQLCTGMVLLSMENGRR